MKLKSRESFRKASLKPKFTGFYKALYSQILILRANINNFMSLEMMDAVERIGTIEMPALRVFRDRTNLFEIYNEEEFKQRFRFNKQTVHLLLDLISSDLEHGLPNKNNFIPPISQIAVALRFYAIGHFQITDGDLIGISQPSVCRIIERASKALAKRKPQFIKFPTAGSLQNIKLKFNLYSQSLR